MKEGFSGLEEITKHLPGGVFAEVNTKETKGRSYTLKGRRETETSVKICKRGRVGILLTGLTSAHFCVCPKPGPGFPTSYVVVFLCSKI